MKDLTDFMQKQNSNDHIIWGIGKETLSFPKDAIYIKPNLKLYFHLLAFFFSNIVDEGINL